MSSAVILMALYNCEATLERLYDYLDEELDPGEEAGVRQHLESCASCRAVYRFEAQFLVGVRERCHVSHPPPHLLSRIEQALDHL